MKVQPTNTRVLVTLFSLVLASLLVQPTRQAERIQIDGIGDLDQYLESLDQELNDLQDAVDTE